MNTGKVIGGAIKLVRRRRVLAIGVVVAIMGLVYALLDAVLRNYNKDYLNDLGTTLTTRLPDNFGLLVLAALLVAALGGLAAEGGLILGAGGKAAAVLLTTGAGATQPTERTGGAVARLPQLLAVGFLVWWKLLLALAIVFSPFIYWVASGQSQDEGALLGVIGSLCIGTVVFLIGWFWLWPQQRLANCALLLENLTPRVAVRSARDLYRNNLGSALGFWLTLVLINIGLLLASVVFAALGAGLVSAVWSLLEGVEETPALIIIGLVALFAAVILLIWDGATSAFNLNAWVLAYLDLRTGGGKTKLVPEQFAGTTQVLGRQRELGWDALD